VLTGTLHLVMIMFLTVGSVAADAFNDIMPIGMAVAMIGCALVLSAVREQYVRDDMDCVREGE
jgi:hypothetical protein